ncbi:hypothetical protein D3C86_2139370 [compost metagenome]
MATIVSPPKVPNWVISNLPDEALARNGAEPLAVLKADTRPARSVVAVVRFTAYGVAPSVTVTDSGVTSKS